jgi:hypothetical protein
LPFMPSFGRALHERLLAWSPGYLILSDHRGMLRKACN